MQNYQRLKDIRNDHDKTQAEIAAVLKTTQSYYAQYETGKREMPIRHYITLAKYYNVSIDYLAGIVPTPKPLRGNAEYSADEVQLVRAWRSRPELQGVVRAALGFSASSSLSPEFSARIEDALDTVARLGAAQDKKKTGKR